MRISFNNHQRLENVIRPFPLVRLLATVLVSPHTKAYPNIVIDSESGEVLQHGDANQSWHPASLTKLMTLYELQDLGRGPVDRSRARRRLEG